MAYLNTERSLYEIEVALSKTKDFNFVKNIVAFNVNGETDLLPLWHECDMLVLSKSGFLTEIEIKRSWTDFKNDFKKKHHHEGRGLIKYFYYCVPKSILEQCYDLLVEQGNDFQYSGIITYDEDLYIEMHGKKIIPWGGGPHYYKIIPILGFRKLFLEEQLQVARYGAMRSIMLKEKLIKQLNTILYLWKI